MNDAAQTEKRPQRGTGVHGVLLIVSLVAGWSVPAFQAWPWLWVVPLIAYRLVVWAVPALRRSFVPWRWGAADTLSLSSSLLFAAGAAVVLWSFQLWRHPDLSPYREMLPMSLAGQAWLAGAVFAVLNALLEELVFRGVLFDAARSQWGSASAVFITACIFGYGHRQGYPPGSLGALLAGIFGLCLGWLRMQTGGLGWPVLVHIVADATIFMIVVRG